MKMPRTARQYGISGYYHIVSRGIGKQVLFEDEGDHLFFLNTLKKYVQEEQFKIIAFCLMENHYHLLLKIDSNMDRIMKKINTRYAFYYNEKYERTGHLFQDRFKSIPVEGNRQFMNVVRYIHNNPAKAGICAPDQYRWSSWCYYTGTSGMVDTEMMLKLAGGVEGFLQFSSEEDQEDHLDIRETHRLKDPAAQKIIRKKLNLDSGTQLQNMNKDKRNAALHSLKEAGLSVRQIERLTGINRGIITRA